MATSRKDLVEIAYKIWEAQIRGTINRMEAEIFVDILEPALRRTTGLNVNGQPKFDAARFRKAAIAHFDCTEQWCDEAHEPNSRCPKWED